MSALFANPSIWITIAMLSGIVALWQSPFARLTLTLILLLFSIASALAAVIAKHRAARLVGRITFIIFLRNVLIETLLVLSVMALAGWLGRYIAQLATQQIGHDFIRFVAGIATGLLVGIGVGMVMHPILGWFVKSSVEN